VNIDEQLAELEHRLSTRDKSADWQLAMAEYQSIRGSGLSWKGTEWKLRRERFLGSTCVQCGSNAPPLVVQHLKHPRSFGQIVRELLRKEWQSHKTRFDDEHTSHLKEERATCPLCTSLNIKRLKESGVWSCYKCGEKSGSPTYRRVMTPTARSEYSRMKRDGGLKELRWEQFKSALTDDQGTAAVLRLVRETREYLQFKYAVTFCKRCAFVWDKKGLRLCQACRTHWHILLEPSCKQCLAKQL